MNNHDQRKHLINPTHVAVAICALAALSGQAAQAQVSFISSYRSLANPVKTAQYPVGTLPPVTPAFVVPKTFSVAATNNKGYSNTLTFTATNSPTPSTGFESNLANATIAPQFSDPAFGGAPGDVIENTTAADPNAGPNISTAPLLIQFANPVSGFGLLAEDFLPDQETFTLNIFADANATVPLGSMTYGPTDSSSSAGTAVFVGAVTSLNLPLIGSATLSSISSTGDNNDLFFGPTQVQTPGPVPEASTMVSFGMGVLLFAGLALGARKRKVNGASKTVSQAAG